MAECAVEECTRRVFSRGWCQMHYTRWLRHGDPERKFVQTHDVGSRVSNRGPYIYVKNPSHPLANRRGWVTEHRMVAWDLGILTDPSDHVHHRNHDTRDNRPENLEAISAAEHVRLHHPMVDECVHGHPYTPENTFIRDRGGRECRECMRQRTSRYRARKAS